MAQARPAACLEEETISRLLVGALSEAELHAADAHLAHCDHCRSVVAAAAWGAGANTDDPVTRDPEPAQGMSPAPHHGGPPNGGNVWGRTPLRTGQLIADKYEIETELGRGGMGAVYAARHSELGHRVAIKCLYGSGHAGVARFLREAQTSARLASDHIVRVFDFGRLPDGAPYIVMEYLIGEDLAALLKRGPIAHDLAAGYVIQACAGLMEAHAVGIVHRDLKPANLFLTQRSQRPPLIKILDFGISKMQLAQPSEDVQLTRTGTFLGSPLYMSPEQIRASNRVDARADIWSLGVILYELIAGRPPFFAPTLSALSVAIATDAPRPLASLGPGLPAGLEAVVRRCLEKSPERRYSSVRQLAEALAPYASLELAASHPPAFLSAAPRRQLSRARAFALSALGLTLAILTGIIVQRAHSARSAARSAEAGPSLPATPLPHPSSSTPRSVTTSAPAKPPVPSVSMTTAAQPSSDFAARPSSDTAAPSSTGPAAQPSQPTAPKKMKPTTPKPAARADSPTMSQKSRPPARVPSSDLAANPD